MKVSTIIPAFNRPGRLRAAIASVLAQTFESIELIVVDDDSNEDLSEAEADVRKAGHRWVRLPFNRGPAAARNAGVGASDGDWIAFLDSDDLWMPEKLDRQLAWHSENPGIEISQCEEVWFRNGHQVGKPAHLRQPPTGRIFEACVKLCCISPSSVMLSRKLWETSGGFDERFRVCEDYELWLRIASEYPVGLVPGELVHKFGGHSDQLSGSMEAMDRFRLLALLESLPGITAEQRKTARSEIRTKSGILLSGARKRAHENAGLYKAVFDWAEDDRAGDPPPGIAGRLEKICFGASPPGPRSSGT